MKSELADLKGVLLATVNASQKDINDFLKTAGLIIMDALISSFDTKKICYFTQNAKKQRKKDVLQYSIVPDYMSKKVDELMNSL